MSNVLGITVDVMVSNGQFIYYRGIFVDNSVSLCDNKIPGDVVPECSGECNEADIFVDEGIYALSQIGITDFTVLDEIREDE
jgi:hypothetical protein